MQKIAVTAQAVGLGACVHTADVPTDALRELAPRSQAFRSISAVRQELDEEACYLVVGDNPLNYLAHLTFAKGFEPP